MPRVPALNKWKFAQAVPYKFSRFVISNSNIAALLPPSRRASYFTLAFVCRRENLPRCRRFTSRSYRNACFCCCCCCRRGDVRRCVSIHAELMRGWIYAARSLQEEKFCVRYMGGARVSFGTLLSLITLLQVSWFPILSFIITPYNSSLRSFKNSRATEINNNIHINIHRFFVFYSTSCFMYFFIFFEPRE